MELKKVRKQYRPEGVSHSSLSWFEISPKYFKEAFDGTLEKIEKDYFDIGTKLHYYLLQPEEFNKLYVYLEYNTPRGEKQKEFCGTYLSLKTKGKKSDEDAAIRAYEKTYVVKNKSKDKVKEEALSLYKDLKKYLVYLEAANVYKDVLNYTTLTYLQEAKKQVYNHKLAKDLLGYTESNVEAYNEQNIIWEHPVLKDIKCSSTLDRFVIDHDNKIIKIVDLKTTYNLSGFINSFEKFKYYRQIAFYWMAIEYLFKQKYPNENYNDYIKESYIIAFQTQSQTNNLLTECEVFNINEEWLNKGKEELNTVLSELAWHFEKDLWDHRRIYYEGNGSINL